MSLIFDHWSHDEFFTDFPKKKEQKMPYILKELRESLESELQALEKEFETSCTQGVLNYLITRLCLKYLEKNHRSYTTLNDVVGVLECAKLEFYRRRAVDYENDKARVNGDIYGKDLV